MKNSLSRILEIPIDDPEVARKAHLLNICLTAVGVAAALLAVINIFEYVASSDPIARILAIYSSASFGGCLLAFWLNRRRWHRLAGYIFLLLIIYIITSATRPAVYLFEGSTVLAYVLPIVMASVILEAWSSFVITSMISLVLLAVARLNGIIEDPTPETLMTLYMLAMVAWLSARSLNQALQRAREHAEELRVINLELDKRVAGRTQDLQQANYQLVEALRREHAEASKNQAILEGIADGVIVFDTAGQAIVGNPAVEKMMSMPLQAIIGTPITQLIENQENSEAHKAIAAALSPEVSSPLRFNFQQGSQIISASLAPIALPGEYTHSVVAVFHDVTKEVEADRAKSEFVSIVSHELRTPLTSIKGYTDLLAMGAVGHLNEEQKKFLTIVKTNADRLTALLSDLLDISRVETGRIRLDMKEVDIEEAVNDVAASIQPEVQRKGLTLVTDIAPGIRRVRGDRSRIVQVLNNLLSNAYRYTPAGGTIRVSVTQSDSTLQVDVADTGFGISPKDQAKLFERFYRADDSRVREISGTGLGLAITRMFVELHGGRIWMQSELNKGSTFTFVLPTIRPAVERASDEPVRLRKPGVKRRVLVVEDDQGIAELIRYHLENDDCQVRNIGLGREVLPTVHAWRPDVITMDILLPDADGLEILRELKQNAEAATIPVIILSVMPGRDSGLQMGAADYLVKPLQGDQLLRSVERAFGELTQGKGQQILVVDDEPDVRHWIRDALALYGFRVAEAANGQEAIEQVARVRPSLILLDLKMPRMDGYTTIRKLKSDKATADIPVVVLSASSVSKEQDALELLNMGAKRFLTKPVSVEMLVAEIQSQLAVKVGATTG